MDNKEAFIKVLTATKRVGMDKVIAGLEELGFFVAPASTHFHGNEPGGLLQHSINVYKEAMLIREVQLQLRPDLAERLTPDSIAIVSLLHDVCKAEIYKEVEKWRKDASNKWEKYTAYEADHSALPLGHGEKSVIRLLRWGLDITDDEMLAIRWHMHAWDLSPSFEAKSCYGVASDNCPLLSILMAADGLASRLLEVKKGD